MRGNSRSNAFIPLSNRVADELGNLTTVSRWTEVMSAAVCKMGFNGASLTHDICDLQRPSIEVGSADEEIYSSDFLQHWHKQRCRMLDPTNHLSRGTTMSFSWGRRDDDWSVSIDLDRQQRKVMDLIFGLGITGGITVPIYLPEARNGVVTRACQDAVVLRQLANTYRWSLLISQAALYSWTMLAARAAVQEAGDNARLTAREIECVNWVARGSPTKIWDA